MATLPTNTSNKERSVIEHFDYQSQLNPDRIALIFNDQTMSYGQLQTFSQQFSIHMTEAGIQAGDIVCLDLHPGFDMVSAILGAFKIGAIYMPVDVEYPAERISHMITDASPKLVITNHKLKEERYTQYDGNLLDTRYMRLLDHIDEQTFVFFYPDLKDSAYLLYTSGSSGKPKGVLGTHKGIVTRVEWMQRNYPFSSDEVFCYKSNIGFVDSIWDIFQPLVAGTSLVILDPKIFKDPILFVSALKENSVTRLSILPAHFEIILDFYPDLSHRLKKLKLLDLTSGNVSLTLYKKIMRAMPKTTILNRYGLTEAPSCICHEVKSLFNDTTYMPIGKPIDGSYCYILDEDQQPVSGNETGEICIGGDQVANGYINQSDLNNQRFIKDPITNSVLSIVPHYINRTKAVLGLTPKMQTGHSGGRDY